LESLRELAQPLCEPATGGIYLAHLTPILGRDLGGLVHWLESAEGHGGIGLNLPRCRSTVCRVVKQVGQDQPAGESFTATAVIAARLYDVTL